MSYYNLLFLNTITILLWSIFDKKRLFLMALYIKEGRTHWAAFVAAKDVVDVEKEIDIANSYIRGGECEV